MPPRKGLSIRAIFNINNNNNKLKLPVKLVQQQKRQPLVRLRNIRTSRLITFFSQLLLSHWVQSMRQASFSFLISVASLLISRTTTEKSAFYFSDSLFMIQRYNAILLHDCFVKEEEE